MKKYFPYDLENPQPVSGEVHQIVGGKIRLTHVPVEGTLTVIGFIEAKSATSLQRNEFFCNYSRETYYRDSNRIVYFNNNLSGQSVSCSYMACGSPVTSDDMNEIKKHMEESEEIIGGVTSEMANLRNMLVNAQTGLNKSVTEHNLSPTAHSDIRDLINANDEKNLLAHAQMNQDITKAVNDSKSALLSVTNHISDPTAHADIRNDIELEKSARLDADNILDEKISALSSAIDSLSFAGEIKDTSYFHMTKAYDNGFESELDEEAWNKSLSPFTDDEEKLDKFFEWFYSKQNRLPKGGDIIQTYSEWCNFYKTGDNEWVDLGIDWENICPILTTPDRFKVDHSLFVTRDWDRFTKMQGDDEEESQDGGQEQTNYPYPFGRNLPKYALNFRTDLDGFFRWYNSGTDDEPFYEWKPLASLGKGNLYLTNSETENWTGAIKKDSDGYKIYDKDSDAWSPFINQGQGNLYFVGKGSSFPSNSSVGALFYKTDEQKFYLFDGEDWLKFN